MRASDPLKGRHQEQALLCVCCCAGFAFENAGEVPGGKRRDATRIAHLCMCTRGREEELGFGEGEALWCTPAPCWQLAVPIIAGRCCFVIRRQPNHHLCNHLTLIN